MIAAPLASAAFATSDLDVSMEMGMGYLRPEARDSRIGRTRRSSSSVLTPSDPGRVDSPPMSRMSAPSSAICQARSTANPWLQEKAFVGERIGSDVQDSHHQRSFA